jgi:hypothetical protein
MLINMVKAELKYWSLEYLVFPLSFLAIASAIYLIRIVEFILFNNWSVESERAAGITSFFFFFVLFMVYAFDQKVMSKRDQNDVMRTYSSLPVPPAKILLSYSLPGMTMLVVCFVALLSLEVVFYLITGVEVPLLHRWLIFLTIFCWNTATYCFHMQIRVLNTKQRVLVMQVVTFFITLAFFFFLMDYLVKPSPLFASQWTFFLLLNGLGASLTLLYWILIHRPRDLE